jgi:hypothetical protein
MKEITAALSPVEKGRLRVIAVDDVGGYRMVMEGSIYEKRCQDIIKILLQETVDNCARLKTGEAHLRRTLRRLK